ncbi:MAG: hypothetical protein Tsb009_17440 [Planctomycetaceae bacterium]
MIAPGPVELMTILAMSGLFWGGGVTGMMGLPPAERDATLAQCPPANAVLYMEWSSRSSGKPGGKGIDGFAGDPEIRAFFKELEAAILKAVEKESANGNAVERTMAQSLPYLIKTFLNHSGCLYAGFDPKVLANAGQGPARWMAAMAGVKVTLIVNAGDDADAMAAKISKLLELLPEEARKENLNRQQIPLPVPVPGASLILHRHKKYFILGFGKGAVDQAVSGLTGKTKGLLGNEQFVAASKKVAFKRMANLTWVDAKTILKTAEAIVGPQVQAMAKMIGADSLGHVMTSTGVVEGEIRTKTSIATGGKTDGIFSLLAGRAMKPADFSHIPADSDFVYAVSINAPKILTAVKKITAAADPGSKQVLDELIKQLEEELGLSLEKDLFAAFGDVWTFHDSKSSGGFLISSLVGSLEVRDPAKAEDVFSKLMDTLEESLPSGNRRRFRPYRVTLRKKPFLNATIYYINTVGDEFPFAPAFCLTNKRLLVAPHPQALKAHLRFLKSGDANFMTKLTKNNEFPTGDLICYNFCESKRLLRYFVIVAPYVGQMILSETQSLGGFDLDIFSVPSARAILPYFGNSSSAMSRTKEGLFIEGKTGLSLSSAVFGLAPMLLFSARAVELKPARKFQKIEEKLNKLDRASNFGGIAFFRYLRATFGRKTVKTSWWHDRSHRFSRIRKTSAGPNRSVRFITGA